MPTSPARKRPRGNAGTTNSPQPRPSTSTGSSGSSTNSNSNTNNTNTNTDNGNYTITETWHQAADVFGIRRTNFQVSFNHSTWNGKKLTEIWGDLTNCFDDVLQQTTSSLSGRDRVKVTVSHGDLTNPIVIPLQPVGDLTPEVIMGSIEKTLQSHEGMGVDTSFHVTVSTLDLPKGGGGSGIPINCLDPESEFFNIFRKKSFVEVPDYNDLNCFARAVSIALSKREGESVFKNVIHKERNRPRERQRVSKRPFRSQTVRAKELHEKAGVPIDEPVTIQEIYKFERAIDHQIIVITNDLGLKVIYPGEKQRSDKIFLFLLQNHYHLILNPKGLFRKSEYCFECLKPYTPGHHSCNSVCRVCLHSDCTVPSTLDTASASAATAAADSCNSNGNRSSSSSSCSSSSSSSNTTTATASNSAATSVLGTCPTAATDTATATSVIIANGHLVTLQLVHQVKMI